MNPRFFVSWDGAMHRDNNFSAPFRPTYRKHHASIRTGRQLRETLRAMEYATLDSFTWYWLSHDGESICQDCARENFRAIMHATRYQLRDGWRVVAACQEYAEAPNYCAHCGQDIAKFEGDRDD